VEQDEAIATNRIQRGAPVAYRGQDDNRDILNQTAPPALLFQGHPGRITDPSVQHIRVDWAGLEDEPASFAVGFCPTTVDGGRAGPTVPGLAEISEEEFRVRKQRIESGRCPLP